MGRKAKATRQNFEAGKVSGWSTGDWGRTVRVFSERGRIKITFPGPNGRPKQDTLFGADSRDLRRKATETAVVVAERVRSGAAKTAGRLAGRADTITIYEVALLYMQRVPGFDERLFACGRKDIEAWYNELPREIRDSASIPSANTVWTDVYGLRRLWADDRFRRDRKVMELEPADGTTYFSHYVRNGGRKGEGGSPRTAVNDLDRLSCAIQYVMRQYRKTIALPYNPLDGRKVDRTKANIEHYTTVEGEALRRAAPRLAARGRWQGLVAVGISVSGRRIGSIVHLTAADHDLEKGTVTWRAEVAKGQHYGRGDEVRPMARLHRQAVEWAIAHRPNPLGSDAPLIWGKRDPGRPIPQPTLWKQLMRLEEYAKVAHKAGRAWHSFRRWAATHLADEIGDGPASEFIGMTTDTLRRYRYKKVQPDTMLRVSGAIDLATSEERVFDGQKEEAE